MALALGVNATLLAPAPRRLLPMPMLLPIPPARASRPVALLHSLVRPVSPMGAPPPRLRLANVLEPPWVFVLMLVGMISFQKLEGDDEPAAESAGAIDQAQFALPMLRFLFFMILWQVVLRDVWDALSGQVQPTKKAFPPVDLIGKLPAAIRTLILFFIFFLAIMFSDAAVPQLLDPSRISGALKSVLPPRPTTLVALFNRSVDSS